MTAFAPMAAAFVSHFAQGSLLGPDQLCLVGAGAAADDIPHAGEEIFMIFAPRLPRPTIPR